MSRPKLSWDNKKRIDPLKKKREIDLYNETTDTTESSNCSLVTRFRLGSLG